MKILITKIETPLLSKMCFKVRARKEVSNNTVEVVIELYMRSKKEGAVSQIQYFNFKWGNICSCLLFKAWFRFQSLSSSFLEKCNSSIAGNKETRLGALPTFTPFHTWPVVLESRSDCQMLCFRDWIEIWQKKVHYPSLLKSYLVIYSDQHNAMRCVFWGQSVQIRGENPPLAFCWVILSSQNIAPGDPGCFSFLAFKIVVVSSTRISFCQSI